MIIQVDKKKLLLIKQQLDIDMEKGIQNLTEKTVEGLYQIALLKKSGENIDINKFLKAGVEAMKEAAKSESAKD